MGHERQTSAGEILARCSMVDQICTQAMRQQTAIQELETRLDLQLQDVAQKESDVSTAIEMLLRAPNAVTHMDEHMQVVREQWRLASASVAETLHHLQGMRPSLASLFLAKEEQHLTEAIRAYLLVQDVTATQTRSLHSRQSSDGFSSRVPSQDNAPELRAYYDAAGWVGVWRDRIQDLRMDHAPDPDRGVGALLYHNDDLGEAFKSFEQEETDMLRELQEAKRKADSLLQQCINAGIDVPHRLPPSTTYSENQSMSAVDLGEAFASSPKNELPLEPPSPSGDVLDVSTGNVTNYFHNLAEHDFSASMVPAYAKNDAVEAESLDAGSIVPQQTRSNNFPPLMQSDVPRQVNRDGNVLPKAWWQDAVVPWSGPSSPEQNETIVEGNSEHAKQGESFSDRDPDAPRRIQTTKWQGTNQTVFHIRDLTSDVDVLYQTDPKQTITDPVLLHDGISATGLLLPTEGKSEYLFESYRRRENPSKYFAVGRVFFTLWAEPSENRSATSIEGVTQSGRHGEQMQVYSRVRRFVVIQGGNQRCSCLPITTYNNCGVAKEGVIKFNHSIVHTTPMAPEPSEAELPRRGEKGGMQPDAIRVNVDDPSDQLAKMSRLDYATVYTIDHSVKVRNFGKVHSNSQKHLTTQFKIVWREARRATDDRRRSRPGDIASQIRND